MLGDVAGGGGSKRADVDAACSVCVEDDVDARDGRGLSGHGSRGREGAEPRVRRVAGRGATVGRGCGCK